MGHFGVKKTEDVLAAHFFWPKMRWDVERFVARCTTCQKAKSRLNPHGLYMPLSVPSISWEDIERSQHGKQKKFLRKQDGINPTQDLIYEMLVARKEIESHPRRKP